MTANPVGAGSGETFYNNQAQGTALQIEPFRRFCKCEYGDLVTAAISAFGLDAFGYCFVTETLEIGEDNT